MKILRMLFIVIASCISIVLPKLCMADGCTDLGLTKEECAELHKTPPCIFEGYTIKNPFPLPELVGKSEAAVGKILGKPEAREKGKKGWICHYKCGTVSIKFIKGTADKFIVKVKDTLYIDTAISALDLSFQKPDDFQKRHAIWHNIDGILSVEMFAGDNAMVNYFVVKAQTP